MNDLIKMIKSKKIKTRILAVMFFVGAVLLIAWRLNSNFQSDVIGFSKQMTKEGLSEGAGGVSMGSVYFEEGGSPNQLIAHVKPGDTYYGQLYVVNTKDAPAEVELKIQPLNCSGAKTDECEKRADFDPKYFEFIDLKEPKITLDVNEIRIVDFALNPPISYEEGLYFASINSVDQEKKKVQQGSGSFDFMAAYAIPMKVDVTNKAGDFKYNKLIDDPRDLAFQNMLISLRIYGSIFLAALALVFVYRSYKKT